ncbi:MAG: hypothetical protein HGA71_19885 [Azonexaceae bacterium]|nr:hypothetical protein [Azonexaceae bacterium]
MNGIEYLVGYIKELIDHHTYWSWFNWVVLQALFWVSILASSGAAFLAATGTPKKNLVAFLAILPAICATAESSLSFNGRYRFHDDYIAKLKSMQLRLKVESADPKAISEELRKYEERMSGKYPSTSIEGGVGAAKTAGTS